MVRILGCYPADLIKNGIKNGGRNNREERDAKARSRSSKTTDVQIIG